MLIAAFVSLYLNVRKPREILQDWGTLGSSVAWASGPGYPVPAGREGQLRPVPRGTTPDRSAPAADWGLRSTSRPIRTRDAGLGLPAPRGAEARKVNPQALVPRSLHLSRLRRCRAGLVESSRKNLVLGAPEAGQ